MSTRAALLALMTAASALCCQPEGPAPSPAASHAPPTNAAAAAPSATGATSTAASANAATASPSSTATAAQASAPAPVISAAVTATPAAPVPSSGPAPVAAARSCAEGCYSIERCEADRCVPACPAGEVYIPATGAAGFVMGAGMRKRVDPPHKVVLSKPFCMDADEVTVRAYKACVDAKVCSAPRPWGMWINYPKLLDHPVNKVHWRHGKHYCEWRQQALPTEAQWEWAAGGGDGHKWPWGDASPSCKHADFTPGFQESASGDDGCHGGGTSEVGSHPAGDRVWPTGKIHDLAGNVWEWCLDNYKPYTDSSVTDPLYLRDLDGVHVVRGGGWNRSARGILVHYRGGAVADYQVPGLGFRCIRNPKADP